MNTLKYILAFIQSKPFHSVVIGLSAAVPVFFGVSGLAEPSWVNPLCVAIGNGTFAHGVSGFLDQFKPQILLSNKTTNQMENITHA
jgi:hypothetical protein